jgi:hypothetical protein
MISKEQAIELAQSGRWFHYGNCTRVVGPRGGVSEHVVQVRPSGKCQTWKTRPAEFRLPCKHGLYESGEVTERNAASFHTVEDCPIRQG